MLASTNRSRSSGSSENTPWTITMAMPLYRRFVGDLGLGQNAFHATRPDQHNGPNTGAAGQGMSRTRPKARRLSM
jgi:hypothetical protein